LEIAFGEEVLLTLLIGSSDRSVDYSIVLEEDEAIGTDELEFKVLSTKMLAEFSKTLGVEFLESRVISSPPLHSPLADTTEMESLTECEAAGTE